MGTMALMQSSSIALAALLVLSVVTVNCSGDAHTVVPEAEWHETAPSTELGQQDFPFGGDMSSMMKPVVCKLRVAVHIAEKAGVEAEAMKPLEDAPIWKSQPAAKTAFDNVLACVKDESKTLATCEADAKPLAKNMLLLMSLMQPLQKAMKTIEDKEPDFKKEVMHAAHCK